MRRPFHATSIRRQLSSTSLAALTAFASHGHAASDPVLDAALDAIAPGTAKWASVCVVESDAAGAPIFEWIEYRDTGLATNFWPASTIKLYAAIAALELLHEHGFGLETAVIFERREGDGKWVLDCARSIREMLSEVFRRSSNEDYTLLLRMTGIDRINTQFLIPERGFPHSALMRGYVLGRPYGYVREEPQRITLRAMDGRTQTIEHTWSGRHYAEERGCTIIDSKTGNVTSTRELADCLRRVMFHEHLPEAERFHLSVEQLDFLRNGDRDLWGLRMKVPAAPSPAWLSGIGGVFPEAALFHKTGAISNYALDVAFIDDSARSGKRFILAPAIAAGLETKPVNGEELIRQMSRAIAAWVRDRPRR